MLESEMLAIAKASQNGALKLGIPRFVERAQRNDARSEAEGRAVFDKVVYVEIHHPGDLKTRPCFRVDSLHHDGRPFSEVFRDAYEAWQRTKSNTAPGTPLEQCPQLDVAQVEELRAIGVTTAEQFAELADDVTSRMRLTKTQASVRLWLKPESEATRTLKADLAKRDAVIAEMEARLAQLEKAKK